MAYPASKKVGYFGQLGVLGGIVAGGFVITAFVTAAFMFSKGAINMQAVDEFMVPENANVLRILQLITTFLLFFVPAVMYALICHREAFLHLGYRKSVSLKQLFVVMGIMAASLPFVGLLGEVVDYLPFSESTMKYFQQLEDDYMKQIEVIGRMESPMDFVLSLFMLAIFPALFEETLFRGALQNLFSRWWKAPILAIIITSIIFSLIHFSFIGFLGRFALGFVLGWLYHRTGNLWLSIIAHMTNNAIALTVLYVMKIRDPEMNINESPEFGIILGLVSIIAVTGLLFLFERVSKHQIHQPGMEEPIADNNDPFKTDTRYEHGL